MDISTRYAAFTPVRLLVAAVLALLANAAGTLAYPHLVAAAAPPAVLIIFRAASGLCLIAVFLLPVGALVRRLVR